MNSSAFYLERVGFEANVRLRLNLKNGTNRIGRSDVKTNDFVIDSMRCSGNHCIVTVSDDSVQIKNLSKSTGTTVNGVKMMMETNVTLEENDVIGIVRGTTIPWNLAGNYNLFVYRLRKYTSENLLTIEIDDDETIDLSDDDAADNIIIYDTVDVKVEHDLHIELSRNFNAEIKEELRDIDEFENHCKHVKKEPSNFFDIESYQEPNGYIDAATFDPHIETFDPHLVDSQGNSTELLRVESNESSETINFSTTDQDDDNQKSGPITVDDRANVSNYNESDVRPNDIISKAVRTPDSSDQVEGSLKQTVTKAVDGEKRKKSTELITPQPMRKRSKRADNENQSEKVTPISKQQRKVRMKSTSKPSNSHKEKGDNENQSENVPIIKQQKKVRMKSTSKPPKPSNSHKEKADNENQSENVPIIKQQRKVRMKSTSKPSNSYEEKAENKNRTENVTPIKQQKKVRMKEPSKSFAEKEKPKTTAKVKYTENNRGSFLIDPKQMPGLPASVNERRKSRLVVPLSSLQCKENKIEHKQIEDKEIDAILAKLDIPLDTPLLDDPSYSNFKAKKLSFNDLRQHGTRETVDPNIKSPVQNGNTSQVQPNDDRISDEGVSTTDINNISYSETNDDQTYVKESGFQVNPCHEIISILTAYDSEQFQTVDAFCRSTELAFNSFGDTFRNFSEYQSTILPLMMLELWNEIELEYINSEKRDFTTVTLTDKNIEKRGEGHRMIFHCQVDLLCKSQNLCDGHIVYACCAYNQKNIEFLAIITQIAYKRKTADRKLAHFIMETSHLTEVLPIQSLRIRPITVISNTLNAFRCIMHLDKSPLLNLITNPLSGQLPSKDTTSFAYKGYDKLDTDQMPIMKAIYNQCANLEIPSISLLDGAAGSGKSCMAANLALQLVYGANLPKPLRILICSRSNRNIDEITKRLLHVRNITCPAQKIQLIRFGLLEQIDPSVRCVSVQHLKENEKRFLQSANLDKLEKEKKTLELKMRALLLDDENDNEAELKLWKTRFVKVDTLIGRLAAVDKSRLNDTTTILLNACDVICTTLGSVAKLQNHLTNVDVCIIDEATQCNEPLTLLPFRFGMSSVVLVGDSQLAPPMVYSSVANDKNYGKSLFSRIQKLYLRKSGSPIYRINIQHRMHPEILKWPNSYFYNNSIHQNVTKGADSFLIVPYKIISYSPVQMESDYIKVVVDVLLNHLDRKKYSIGIIVTDFQQKMRMQNKLSDHPYITMYSADESSLSEKDVIIIWISKEFGLRHLCGQTIFNRAVTRARHSLLIFGCDLMSYKSRSNWKSLLENAQERKCYHHMKVLLQTKLVNVLRKKV